MNDHATLWNWLFLVVTSTLLIAPMYPAWKEWMQPQDTEVQTLEPTPSPAAPLSLPCFRLTADMPVHPRIEATESITVLPGSHFAQLVAPRIDFGARPLDTALALPPDTDAHCVPLEQLAHASAWGTGGWRIQGNCRIPAAHRVTGSLVVTGQLSIEHDCLIEGSIKAHGDIRLAPRTVVTGAVMGEQDVVLESGCRVHGPVVCEKQLLMARDVVLGQSREPTSVSAQTIMAQSGARVYGTVWAQQSGTVA